MNRTLSSSVEASLSRHWDMKNRPTFSESSGDDDRDGGSIFKNISIRGIMVSSLPAFISMALILALSKIPIFSGLEDVFDLVLSALPAVIAAIEIGRAHV